MTMQAISGSPDWSGPCTLVWKAYYKMVGLPDFRFWRFHCKGNINVH